jgi:hypothetical protein
MPFSYLLSPRIQHVACFSTCVRSRVSVVDTAAKKPSCTMHRHMPGYPLFRWIKKPVDLMTCVSLNSNMIPRTKFNGHYGAMQKTLCDFIFTETFSFPHNFLLCSSFHFFRFSFAPVLCTFIGTSSSSYIYIHVCYNLSTKWRSVRLQLSR